MITWIVCIVGAYLIGSIPFGVALGRMRGVDIRQHGSKNIGATNVGRVLGKPLGVLCFFLDFLKGAVPVASAGIITGVFGTSAIAMEPAQLSLWLATAMAAVLGHMFSIFLKFRGGKGVATGFGAMLAMWPVLTLPAIAAFIVWFAIVKVVRIMSVASMAGVVAVPVGFALTLIPPSGENIGPRLQHGLPGLIATVALALLVIWRHRGNISRLMRGEEPRVGPSKKTHAPRT